MHTVAFVMADGDNLQWLINGFYDVKWYGSPLRGSIPISWTMSGGSVGDVATPILSKIYDDTTVNDSFVIGPILEIWLLLLMRHLLVRVSIREWVLQRL